MSNTKQEVGEITELLSRWKQAKDESLNEVFPQVYEKLKKLAKTARRRMERTNPDDTLGTLGLVHEMYLKLSKKESLTFESSGQFYGFCLVAMQRILRDYYLRKSSKREEVPMPESSTGDGEIFNFSSEGISASSFYTSLEAQILCNEMLTKLAEKHPRKVEVLILKYQFGETDSAVAESLNISKSTVRRDCELGEILLNYEINQKMRVLVDEAAKIADPTLRDEHLEKACEGNKGMLKHLKAMMSMSPKKQ